MIKYKTILITITILLLSINCYILIPKILNKRPHTIKSDIYLSNDDLISIGFNDEIKLPNYKFNSQILFGSNAIEHGINMLESQYPSLKRVTIIHGWNCARSSDLYWELEPRNYIINSIDIDYNNSTLSNVNRVINCLDDLNSDLLIAIGGSTVIDIGKYVAQKYSKDIKLIVIPQLPLLGSETNSYISNKIVYNHTNTNRIVTPSYINTISPELLLVQPSFSYNTRIDLINSRIVSLISLSIDIILSDPGFLPEYLACDALRKLIPLLDKAIDLSILRKDNWNNNRIEYEELTMHDDETKHTSQYTRRFGNMFTHCEINELYRISTGLSTSKHNINITSLYTIADMLIASLNHFHRIKDSNFIPNNGIYSYIITFILPNYLQSLTNWCNTKKPNDYYKDFISMRLNEINTILKKSKYLSNEYNSLHDTMNQFITNVLPNVWSITNGDMNINWMNDTINEWSNELNSNDFNEFKEFVKINLHNTPISKYTTIDTLNLFKSFNLLHQLDLHNQSNSKSNKEIRNNIVEFKNLSDIEFDYLGVIEKEMVLSNNKTYLTDGLDIRKYLSETGRFLEDIDIYNNISESTQNTIKRINTSNI